MTQRVCRLLVSGCWLLGALDSLLSTPITMSFPFCKSRKILSFFCEAPALLRLSCSDVSLYKMLMYLCCIFMLLVPTVVISSSYTLILLLISGPAQPRAARSAAGCDGVGLLHHPHLVLKPLIHSLHNKDVTATPRSLLQSRRRLPRVLRGSTWE
ncbi:Hypothetical predicted protein [Marmota monax]|uniref:G-protein coupled receptors family 1 profile domain-containing protein n=1 Tax=Marmota monax TaxID=9995 RepID=A0A5E4B4I7_MARMO|nr:Hypothetical predicted protein [Marmota monax]